MNSNVESVIEEIKTIDPTFSLSGHLQTLKHKKEESDKMKNTLAWKVFHLGKGIYAELYKDAIYVEIVNPTCDIYEFAKSNHPWIQIEKLYLGNRPPGLYVHVPNLVQFLYELSKARV